MKLQFLTLQNFRQHILSRITFNDGLIGIIGPNGVGKSTLIEAISFALFGSEAIRGKLEDLPTKGENNKNTLVTLTFEHDKTLFRIERSISDAKLYSGGSQTPLSKGSKDVRLRIQNILSMNYEEFSATFYTEQKSLEFLSQKNGGTQREKFIMRMMGYDKVEKVQERVREERKENRSILSGYASRSISKDEVAEGIVQESERLKTLQAELNADEEIFKKYEQEASELKKVLEAISAQRDEFLMHQKEMLQAEAIYSERTKKVSESAEKVSVLLKKIKNLEEDLVSPVEENILSYSEITHQIETLAQDIQPLTLLIRDEVIKADHSRKDLERKSNQISERLKQISTLGITNERCPTCGQLLSSLEDSLHHLNAELLRLDEQRKLFETKSNEHLELEEKYNSAHQHMLALEEKKHRVESLYKISVEIVEMRKEKEHIEEELGTLRDSLKEIHEKILAVKTEASKINFSEERYHRERSKYDTATSLLSAMRLERVRKEGDIKGYQGRISEKQELLKKLVEEEAYASAISEKLMVLEEADLFLTDFRKYLVGTLRPRLAEIASAFLLELTDGRYSTLEFSDDFLPFIVDEGVKKSVISGGEEDILYLSVRLALSHMLAERAGQDFSLLILDEVFGSLDESRRQNVLYLLRRLCERFEQIILISHFDDVKDSVDTVISLILDDQTNRVTVEEAVGLKEAVNI